LESSLPGCFIPIVEKEDRYSSMTPHFHCRRRMLRPGDEKEHRYSSMTAYYHF
jgi:hypothetical protein